MPHPRKRHLLTTTALAVALSGMTTAHAADPAPADPPTHKRVVIDPAPERVQGPRAVRATSRAAAPLTETFELHSKPGSPHTIYLDFDGHTVTGTYWNDEEGLSAAPRPAWDPDNDGPAFSDNEKTKVQEIWTRVAEDYAPFDVDVTTEEPTADALRRTGEADKEYGVRVLITPSGAAMNTFCAPYRCGGVALLDVFANEDDEDTSYYHPAWVFPQELDHDPAAIADAASHEAGHTMTLEHHGKGGDDYHEGHGSWGPIMGAPYDKPVTQWSRGDYPDASNPTQDDVAILAGQLGLRTDENNGTIDGATPLADLVDGAGVIAQRTDRDTYALGNCQGPVDVAAAPAALGANLNIRLRLLDGSGGEVVSRDDPAGLDASIITTVAEGAYYAEVDGVGDTGPSPDYDDYGSLGAYTLTATGCDDNPTPADTTPPDTTITAGPAEGSTVQNSSVTFTAAGTPGDTARLECRLDTAAWTDCASPRTFTGLADGEHIVEFRAVDAAGNIDPTPARRTFTVAAPATPVTPATPVSPSPACVAATQAATTATAKVVKAKAKVKKAKKARNGAKVKRLKAKLKKAKQGARRASAAQAGACG